MSKKKSKIQFEKVDNLKSPFIDYLDNPPIKLIPKVETKLILTEGKNKTKKSKKEESRKKRDKIKEIFLYTKKNLKKILKGIGPDKHAEYFQDDRFYNLILYNDSGDLIKRYDGSISRKRLKTIASEYPKASIMVGVAQGYFKLLPIQTLVAVSKIKKIVLTSTLIATPDADEEPFEVHNICKGITRLNELLKFLLITSVEIDTVNQITMGEYWYWSFETTYTASIELMNGEQLFYSDLKDKKFIDFLNDFELNMYLV